MITIDGTTGKVYLGEVPTVEADFSGELVTLLSWADEVARLRSWPTPTPRTMPRAPSSSAPMGIGLCRTERMFNAAERLPIVVEMIVADTPDERQAALDKLLPIQRADFTGIFKVMAPHPVTIRLLDPPIHEFLPTERQLVDEHRRSCSDLRDTPARHAGAGRRGAASCTGRATAVARLQTLGRPGAGRRGHRKKEAMLRKVRALFEVNPMLGHRGVRLGITYPGDLPDADPRRSWKPPPNASKAGIEVHPEIMVPQVCTAQELKQVESLGGRHPAPRSRPRPACTVNFKFGTMLEVVRACMRAENLAEESPSSSPSAPTT